MSNKKNDLISIKIPRKLFEKLSEKMLRADFDTIQKYIIYVLEREISSKEEKVHSDQDKKKLKERLQRLGYF
ncbi:CopG family transcriptional regulator [Candidatus Bathyarchaeota archaeon]|nr:MAG: CopG family transcriptional regulator [Candidatus Bathyarchaeota archaeon]